MREVDEAVRTDQVSEAAKKYGIAAGAALVIGLAALGGFLWWQGNSEGSLEEQSETLVGALDEYEAGNFDVADQELAALSEDGSPGNMAAAQMLRAAAALEAGRGDDARALYQRVIDNGDVPQAMRDAAQVRLVSAAYDDMEPAEVIERLGPLANADSDWFGSAGELVAMAYLDSGREEDAGKLLVEIAKDEEVPASLRARTRQLAGVLGYDAIEDVEETLAELGADGPAAEPATAQ